MDKFEFDSELKTIYTSNRKNPFIVEIPPMNYLTFEGTGHPSSEEFQVSCEALFTLSYIVKFEISRKRLNIDYKVNPMEVTWLLDKRQEKTEFTWTMMIMQPEFITKEIIDEAIQIARDKGKSFASDRVVLKTIDFGRCIQCFHRGDYNNMNDTLAKMISFANENGYDCDQYTHDIYLNDMRKTKVENYKTIMRVRIYDR